MDRDQRLIAFCQQAVILYMQYVIYRIFIMNRTLVEVNESPASPKDFYGTYQRPDTILWNSPRKR